MAQLDDARLMIVQRPWHDGLDVQQRRMVRLLVQALCSIYHVGWDEVLMQDRHPKICEVRAWVIYSLSQDAGLKAAQIARIVQRRDAQVFETLHKMRERTTMTPFRHTRAKLDATFARLNRREPICDEDTSWYDMALTGEERVG